MDLELFKTISRYPFINDGEFFDSIELAQNKTCVEKCKDPVCKEYFTKNGGENQFLCPKGFDCFLIDIEKERYILNGLIKKTNRSILQTRREAREAWIVNEDAVNIFINKIFAINKHILYRENESVIKNFSMFHDFKTSMNIFFHCTHDIINKLPGKDFEDKLDQCEKVYKDLFNSLQLITSQLGMMDVIINPKSISFGTLREISISNYFTKSNYYLIILL